MNIRQLFAPVTLIFFITLQAGLPAPIVRTTVDGIVAIVSGQEGSEVITQSDLQRPGFGGRPRTLDELTFEKMVYLDALKHKVDVEEEEVTKYLQMIQRESNVSLQDIEQSFIDVGYTIEEGRDQLRKMQIINRMLSMRVGKNLIVSRKEVENYFYMNPEYVSAEYTFQYAFVPKDGSTDQENSIAIAAHDPKKHALFEWTKPFTIQGADIAPQKEYLKSMHIGTVSIPKKVEGGYELYQLITKKEMRQKTLDERYFDIVEQLKIPKMEQLHNEYKASLEKVCSVHILSN